MHVCIDCGYTSPDFLGRCPNCGEFGTLEKREPLNKKKKSKKIAKVSPQGLHEIKSEEYKRINTGISELDRVLGGGMVPGSVILLGGEPGIGKSTLLLQWGGARSGKTPVLYVNGEESGPQVARRARRLGIDAEKIQLFPTTEIEAVVESFSDLNSELIFIDSIQTMVSEDSSGMPGSVAQLRAVTQKVVAAAKKYGVSFLLVGHVTKQGDIGGPKRLEHMVDTVLYFDEATRGHRFIRTAKNRFGPAGELGIFEMTGSGLIPITDPGQYFSSSSRDQSGCMMTVTLEGNRPLQVEVQALVTPSRYGTPQRSTTGFPNRRLHMLLAVLEKKLGLPFGTQDVFVNVAGGLKLDDPGADLALALALVSSYQDKPLPGGAAFGELGLTGEVRAASLLDMRIKECLRLNNTPVVSGGSGGKNTDVDGVNTVSSIASAVDLLLE